MSTVTLAVGRSIYGAASLEGCSTILGCTSPEHQLLAALHLEDWPLLPGHLLCADSAEFPAGHCTVVARENIASSSTIMRSSLDTTLNGNDLGPLHFIEVRLGSGTIDRVRDFLDHSSWLRRIS